MQYERIEINPDVMYGKPVIRDTRIPVELVLRKLGAGMPAEAIIVDRPRLTLDDILAAQAFAADYLADTRPLVNQTKIGFNSNTRPGFAASASSPLRNAAGRR